MSRELRVAADAARLLPAAHLAQLESTLEDADKRCCVCDELISGGVIELAVFFEQPLTVASFAHSGCLSSGVYPIAGLQRQFERAVGPSGDGIGMATLLGCRQVLPRPLLFLEPAAPFAIAGRDPFERYAELLGLSPVSGPVEQIAPPRTDAFTIAPHEEGLVLRHPLASDLVPAAPAVLQSWWNAADGEALVVVAHGLGLSRDEPPIDEALQFRPAWAAVASIEDFAPQPRPREAAQRLARKLFQRPVSVPAAARLP